MCVCVGVCDCVCVYIISWCNGFGWRKYTR